MKMEAASSGIINLIGRILLASVFLQTALVNKIPKFDQVVQQMAQEGVPMPSVMLLGAVVFLLAGSLSLIVGFQARTGAVLLLIFTIAGTWFFHDFWTCTDPALMQEHLKEFMKNLSISGGLLLILANGPGAFSLDSKPAAKES